MIKSYAALLTIKKRKKSLNSTTLKVPRKNQAKPVNCQISFRVAIITKKVRIFFFLSAFSYLSVGCLTEI